MTGHVPVLKNILKRAVQDAIGGHCNLKYWNNDVGNVINSLLRKIIAVYYVKENKYESIMFDNEPKLYQIPDPDSGAIRVTFDEILAELENFRKTLRKLRDLRMGLILEIYLEEAVKNAIEEKVEAETISVKGYKLCNFSLLLIACTDLQSKEFRLKIRYVGFDVLFLLVELQTESLKPLHLLNRSSVCN